MYYPSQIYLNVVPFLYGKGILDGDNRTER